MSYAEYISEMKNETARVHARVGKKRKRFYQEQRDKMDIY
jgi:hypothetical protein